MYGFLHAYILVKTIVLQKLVPEFTQSVSHGLNHG